MPGTTMNEETSSVDPQTQRLIDEGDRDTRRLILITAMLTAKSCNSFNMPTPTVPQGEDTAEIQLDAVCKMTAYMNFPTEDLCEEEDWSDYNPEVLSDELFLESCVWTPEMCEVLLFGRDEAARVDVFNEAQRRESMFDLEDSDDDDDEEEGDPEYNFGTDLIQLWMLALSWGHATSSDWVAAIGTVSDPEHLTLPPTLNLG